MTTICVFLAVLLNQPAANPTVPAVPPGAAMRPAAADVLAPDAPIDTILEALHARGLELRDFESDVSQTKTDAATGDGNTSAGRILYHKVDETNAQIRVIFETKDEGKGPRPYRREYLLDGPKLIERNYTSKKETTREVLKPGQKLNLFKLGEGPFPLPLGQDPDEVKRQFTVTQLPAANGVPRIRLVPVENTRMANKFSQIDVSVDPTSHFPTHIETTDANKTEVLTTELKNLHVNPAGGIPPSDFVLPKVDADWTYSD